MVLAQRLAEEFERVVARLGPHFRRREAYATASSYVKALLSRAERKNAWGLAEEAGKAAPYCFQHCCCGRSGTRRPYAMACWRTRASGSARAACSWWTRQVS
jgi:hypothetical protein